MAKNNERKEIRIKGVPCNVHQQIKKIEKYEGMEMSTFLRPKLREIANKYPDNIKNYQQNSE